MIKILDVCSGIGGFSLGLEATGGFDTVAFCEYDVGELTGSQEHREGNAESRLGGMVDGISSRLDGHYGFEVEPDIPRVAEKIPDRVNRLKALGNSIVPQVIYHIGMAILEEERKDNKSV